MRFFVGVMWCGALLLAVIALYHVRYESAALEMRARQLAKQYEDATWTHNLMSAEWTHLNDPRYLQGLARTHLALQPMRAGQLLPTPSRFEGGLENPSGGAR